MDVELILQRETERLQAPYLCGPGNTCVDMIKFAESDLYAYRNWVNCLRLLRLTRRPKAVAKMRKKRRPAVVVIDSGGGGFFMEERHCWLAGIAVALIALCFLLERGCARDQELKKAHIASCQAAGGYMESGMSERCFFPAQNGVVRSESVKK